MKTFTERYRGGRETEFAAAFARLERLRPALESIPQAEGVPKELVGSCPRRERSAAASLVASPGAWPLAIHPGHGPPVWADRKRCQRRADPPRNGDAGCRTVPSRSVPSLWKLAPRACRLQCRRECNSGSSRERPGDDVFSARCGRLASSGDEELCVGCPSSNGAAGYEAAGRAEPGEDNA